MQDFWDIIKISYVLRTRIAKEIQSESIENEFNKIMENFRDLGKNMKSRYLRHLETPKL